MTLGLVCDGTVKSFDFDVSGFPASSTRGVLGSSISLMGSPAGVQFILLTAEGNLRKVLRTMGRNTPDAQVIFSGFGDVGFPPAFAVSASIPATANASGDIRMEVLGARDAGAGQVQGIANIWFITKP